MPRPIRSTSITNRSNNIFNWLIRKREDQGSTRFSAWASISQLQRQVMSLSLSCSLLILLPLSRFAKFVFFCFFLSLSLSLSLSSLHPYESIAVALQYAPLAPTRSETAQAAITSGSDRKDADNIASDFPAFLKEGGEWSSKRYQDVVDYYTRFVPLSKTRFSSPNSFLSSSL